MKAFKSTMIFVQKCGLKSFQESFEIFNISDVRFECVTNKITIEKTFLSIPTKEYTDKICEILTKTINDDKSNSLYVFTTTFNGYENIEEIEVELDNSEKTEENLINE